MAYVHGCISIIVKSKFRMTDKEQYLGGKCSNMQLVLIKTLIPWTDFKSKQYKKKRKKICIGMLICFFKALQFVLFSFEWQHISGEGLNSEISISL